MSQLETANDPRATRVRRCASCGQPSVHCREVTQHLYGGLIPSGRTYVHACAGCGAEFETLSPFRLVRDLFFATISPFVGLLVVLYGIDGPWWALLVGGLMTLFGLYWIYATIRAFVAQVRNPAV
ncbi:MAG: hypothetical protein KF729_25965 [Sandaracinaceae bacterium]|nr:hypothetical protein [Sandaracinaceae bacterium]